MIADESDVRTPSIIAARLLPLGLAVALAALAGRAISLDHSLSGEGQPPQRAANLAYRSLWRGDTADAVRRFRLVAEADPAFPYRWTDLGSALADAGRVKEAEAAFLRARTLAPESPQVSLRAANFYFRTGDAARGRELAATVLRRAPLYQEMVFSLLARFGGSPEEVLDNSIGANPELANNYYRFALARDPASGALWRELDSRGLAQSSSALLRARYLLRAGQTADAAEVWRRYLATDKQAWQQSNFVENPGFEREPQPGEGFEWTIQDPTPARAVISGDQYHSGARALRIEFDGSVNIDFRHVAQTLWLRPGAYRLNAWIRTEGITTDQGIRVAVSGRGITGGELPSQTGTADWHRVITPVNVAEAGVAQLTVIRRVSAQFENRPRGVAWLDDITLQPVR